MRHYLSVFSIIACALALAPTPAKAQEVGAIYFSPGGLDLWVVEGPHGPPFYGYAQYVTLQSTSGYNVSFVKSVFQTNVWHGSYASTLQVVLNGTVYLNEQIGPSPIVLTANCPISPATLPPGGSCQAIADFAGSELGLWQGSVTVNGTTVGSPPSPLSAVENINADVNP